MSPFSNNKSNRKKSIDEHLSAHSGRDVDPTVVSASNVPSNDGDMSAGATVETKRIGNLGKAPGILRSKMGLRDKSITQAPPQQHDQPQYLQGYFPGYTPGMMPMQPGTVPPGVMPYMMPSSYYGCSPGHDYTCGHPSIQAVDISGGDGEDFDYSYGSTCNSSRNTTLCSEALADIVRKTVHSVTNSVNDVLDCGANVADYAEESLCEPVVCGGSSVDTPSTLGRSTFQDNAELLEKIDKLYKLVKEKEKALGGGIQEKKDLNPLEALNESAITHHSVTKSIGVDSLESFSADVKEPTPVKVETRATERGDTVEELTSLFSDGLLVEDWQIDATPKQDESAANKAVEKPVISKQSKNILNKLRLGRSHTRMRSRSFIPLKSWQAMKENVIFEEVSSVDSRCSPLPPSPDEKLLTFLVRESVSSPVSVIAFSETRSCAWCGVVGGNTNDSKKLKVCSGCKSTYYCSSECQSKDWIDGHAKTCQDVARVIAEHDCAL